jgi:hypothetical protein
MGFFELLAKSLIAKSWGRKIAVAAVYDSRIELQSTDCGKSFAFFKKQ